MHTCILLEGDKVGPIRKIKADSLIHTRRILTKESQADAEESRPSPIRYIYKYMYMYIYIYIYVYI